MSSLFESIVAILLFVEDGKLLAKVSLGFEMCAGSEMVLQVEVEKRTSSGLPADRYY